MIPMKNITSLAPIVLLRVQVLAASMFFLESIVATPMSLVSWSELAKGVLQRICEYPLLPVIQVIMDTHM